MAAAGIPASEVTPPVSEVIPPVYDVQSVAVEYRSRRPTEGQAAVTRALNHVTLTIDAGERAVIMGRSGSGKSSLLQLLAGLDLPKEGRIFCRPGEEAYALHKMNEDDRAYFRMRHVGFLYQAFHLLPALTAWENVAVPLVFAGVGPEQRKLRAVALLRELDIAELTSRYPYEMSGGEQQRVAIARALVNNPSVLLADEPTGNLDSKSAETLIDLLRGIGESRRVTMVLVTHDDSVERTFATRTIRLDDGMIVERRPG